MSGLYIHIPFCEYKCSYCNFFSIVNQNNKEIHKKYIEALISELKLRIKDYYEIIETIYIGGGTPSIIDINLLKYLFENILIIVNAHNNNNKIKEITIEANINNINSEYINFLESIQNIRLSLGIQTFNEKSLEIINRYTKKEDIINALKLINRSNIDNISLDFICGLPLNSKSQIKDDILFSFDLLPKIKHASLYYLELTNSLEKKWKELLPKDEETVEYYENASQTLESLNLLRYEISNFALENYQSIHNNNYWLLKNYLGIGASSVGCYNNIRYENEKILKNYFDCILKNNLPTNNKEYLDNDIRMKEFVFLSLRKVNGIQINNYYNMFNEDFYKKYSNVIHKYQEYFNISNEYLSIKKSYFNYADEISLLLF